MMTSKEEIKQYVQEQKNRNKDFFTQWFYDHGRRPVLDIIQVGHNPASDAYIKGKKKDGEEMGVNVRVLNFEETATTQEVLNLIHLLNDDASVQGIIVQLPLPQHMDSALITAAVSPLKDVDGFTAASICTPCTPLGIVKWLESRDFNFSGANALVIGRSEIVGKPMARLLLDRNCTVTVAHSRTPIMKLRTHVVASDLIVCAVGKPHLLTSEFYFNPSAWIVDVGINRVDGHLCGDCDPDLPVAVQTPVPGGVGLLTRLALYENLRALMEHVC